MAWARITVINAVIFRSIGPDINEQAEKVSEKNSESSGIIFGSIANRSVVGDTFVPSQVREVSPEFEELQAQINALR